MENVLIDVTVLEPRMKHPTIFDAFDKVAAGYAVVIHNDHDPKPLYYQLLGERGNCFTWTYLSNGPEIWEVEIKKNALHAETIGEIAAKDMRKAELLKKLGIDFECGGKKSLDDACLESGLDAMRVKQELEATSKQPLPTTQLDFNSFKPSFLADYLVNVHHGYINQNIPMIEDLALKVAEHHGNTLTFLKQVYNKVNELRCELATNLKKQEQAVFPAFKNAENIGTTNAISLQETVNMMEHDNDIIGNLMKEIHQLTNNYTAPDGACNSIKMLYEKLSEFALDLSHHIHLENNLLFPKILKLAKA